MTAKRFGGLFVGLPLELVKDESDDRLSANALLVLMALYSFADFNTGKCYPMQTTLATRARVSVATVKRAMAELVKAGMVTVESKRGDSNTYVVQFGSPVDPPSSDGATAGLPESPEGSSERATNDIQQNDLHTNDGGPTDHVADEPRRLPEPSTAQLALEPAEKRALGEASSQTPVELVHAYWQQVIPAHASMGLTKGRRDIIARRLREFTAGQLCQALDVVARDPFLNGQNDRQQRYTDFKTIFRSQEKVEGYILRGQEEAAGTLPTAAPSAGMSRAERDSAAVSANLRGALERIREGR